MKYYDTLRGKKGFPVPAADLRPLYADLYTLVINAFATKEGSDWRVVTVGAEGGVKLRGQQKGEREWVELSSAPGDDAFKKALISAQAFDADQYVGNVSRIDRDECLTLLWRHTGSTDALNELFPALFDTPDTRALINEAIRFLPKYNPELKTIWHLAAGSYTRFVPWSKLFPTEAIPDDRGIFVMECNEAAHLLLIGALMSPYYGNSIAFYDAHRHWGLPVLPDDDVLKRVTGCEFPVPVWHLDHDKFVSSALLPF